VIKSGHHVDEFRVLQNNPHEHIRVGESSVTQPFCPLGADPVSPLDVERQQPDAVSVRSLDVAAADWALKP
jgi:hypothetical protein